MDEKEYIVTVKQGVDWREVHEDLTKENQKQFIPNHKVPVDDLREINKRNTHYHLSDQEAAELRKDSRIEAVEIPMVPQKKALQEGNFNRAGGDTGQQDNWGLLRHIADSNIFGTSTADPGGTYDYVLDGTGVDVVLQDSGINGVNSAAGLHPEFTDANGTSRIKEINWFTESGISGSQPTDFYNDTDGHGTHVASTMAGKKFGWAKNADIYSQTILDSPHTISVSNAMDTLLGWHQAKTNNRPTVVNMSYGYVYYLNTATTPNGFGFNSGGPWYDLVSGTYRGTPHTDTTRSNLRTRGINGQFRGNSIYGFPARLASVDADIKQLTDAGIIVCIAAGNDSMKHDISTGTDYNNSLVVTSFGTWFYHTGGSPNLNGEPGFNVGAIGFSNSNAAFNEKASFSDSGPGVNIYACRQNIIGAWPQGPGYNYYYDNSFFQNKISGTSMASPQMAGMAACLLQAHPDWTPRQVMTWFQNNSTNTILDTGQDDDYTTTNSVHGGPAKVAYFPLKGQKPFGIN
jgi:subtilisin family serine protease